LGNARSKAAPARLDSPPRLSFDHRRDDSFKRLLVVRKQELVRVPDDSPSNTVTLVLNGGHLLRLAGDVDVHALVQHLREPVSDSGVFEIESSRSERLILRRSALIGVVTSHEDHDRPGIDRQASVPFHRFDGFLSPQEHEAVLRRALAREAEFEASAVTTGDKSVRKSVVLTSDEIIAPIFRRKILEVLPQLTGLAETIFTSSTRQDDIECQVTAHLDGGFFQIHNDSGSKETQERLITFVYYFASGPNSFLGGELKIYEPNFDKNGQKANYALVQPTDNTLVFFPSGVMHEVLPTYVPSKKFSDSRFTVNGWIRRSPPRA
jgi:SM-20-related protein